MVAARTPASRLFGIAPESDSADGIREFLTITWRGL